MPDEAPWRVLAAHLEQLEVTEYFFGWMFLASGNLTTPRDTDARPVVAI
ncbi:MAG: hypothetical protein ACT4PJ_06715 [Gemmatimonadaceae bacterium]